MRLKQFAKRRRFRGTIESWTSTATNTDSTTPKTPSQEKEIDTEASTLETVIEKIMTRGPANSEEDKAIACKYYDNGNLIADTGFLTCDPCSLENPDLICASPKLYALCVSAVDLSQ